MKKIFSTITTLLVGSIIYAQSLDTVQVRNLQLRAEEWYWLKGSWSPLTEDEKKAWKKMRQKLVADAPPTNATLVTIDSIPGNIALRFYELFVTSTKEETSFMTNNISQNIRAYPPMVLFCDRIDASFQASFQNRRKNGRDDFEN